MSVQLDGVQISGISASKTIMSFIVFHIQKKIEQKSLENADIHFYMP